MREILFKGKRVDNGEWAFGNFIEDKWGDDNGNTIYAILQDRVAPDIAELWTPVRVIPETVGQFTGLTDKNGKKIFEGDIIETQEYYDKPYSAKKRKKRYIGIVEYVTYKHNNGIYYEAKWYVNIKDFDTYVYGAWSRFYDCTVIGNIHDNPELLEEGEQ